MCAYFNEAEMRTTGKAKAKNDVKIFMESWRFSNFIKGNTYRYMIKGNDVYLIDEDKYGFLTDLTEFQKDFEIVEEST